MLESIPKRKRNKYHK